MNVGSDVNLEGLEVALILAPRTFSRNRFFWLFERADAQKVRRRAARVRGVLRQLAAPDGSAEVIGERVLADGQVLLRYRVLELGYARTSAFSALEAATLRYALHRSGKAPLGEEDRKAVEGALLSLNKSLGISDDRFTGELVSGSSSE